MPSLRVSACSISSGMDSSSTRSITSLSSVVRTSSFSRRLLFNCVNLKVSDPAVFSRSYAMAIMRVAEALCPALTLFLLAKSSEDIVDYVLTSSRLLRCFSVINTTRRCQSGSKDHVRVQVVPFVDNSTS